MGRIVILGSLSNNVVDAALATVALSVLRKQLQWAMEADGLSEDASGIAEDLLERVLSGNAGKKAVTLEEDSRQPNRAQGPLFWRLRLQPPD